MGALKHHGRSLFRPHTIQLDRATTPFEGLREQVARTFYYFVIDIMKYFAYGMNTNLEEMSHRCPTAQCLGPAWIKDHRLVFRTHADIESAVSEQCWGVMWEISSKDLEALDRLEGWPYYYKRKTVMIYQNDRMVSGLVYYMTDQSYEQAPSAGYLECVQEGYQANGVPTAQLETTAR